MGPTLQRRENPLNRDVGEYLCVLPHKMVSTIILKMILKNSFFTVQPFDYNIKNSSSFTKRTVPLWFWVRAYDENAIIEQNTRKKENKMDRKIEKPHILDQEKIKESLVTDFDKGLSTKEARKRLEKFGGNILDAG